MKKIVDFCKNENIISDNIVKRKKIITKTYCTKCGEVIEDGWFFCNYCGNKLKWEY